MTKMVSMGASLKCSFGTAPSSMIVLPINKTTSTFMPCATVADIIPFANILPFAMCQSLANPTVASATAAALGVLTPMPCIPVISAPWSPGSANTTLVNQKALTDNSTCNCTWGGVIEVSSSGQTKIEVK